MALEQQPAFHVADIAALEVLRGTAPVLDALPRAIVATDTKGIVVGWNRVAERLYGWPGDLVVGRVVSDVVTLVGDHARPGTVMGSVVAGQTWRSDFSVRRRDGSPIRVHAVVAPLRDDEGRVVGTVAVAEDVTEHRVAEKRAADLFQHLQLALEAGALGTWRWNMATGEVTWDERLERLFGLEPGTFDGTYESYAACLYPEDRERVLGVVTAAVDAKASYQVDHRVVWPDGSVHWLQGRGNVTLDAAGEVSGTIGCVADITNAKVAEAEAQRMAAEASQLAERERRQREHLEFLIGLSDISISARNHRDFMRSVTAAAVPRLGDWCSLHFVPASEANIEVEVAHSDPDRVEWVKELVQRYPYDPTAPTGVPAVIRSGQFEFIPRVDEHVINDALGSSPIDRDEAQAILDELKLTSVMTLPLTTRRGVLGAIQFVSAESQFQYGENDLALARAAAGRIAEALENLWIADEHRQIAATLQAALLPPALPQLPGIDLAVRYWPAGVAALVGGDFYDVFALADDRWAVVIGDVCGTGANAAAVTSIARHTVRAAARHGADHATVLDWINQAIGLSDRDTFCTACYTTIETTGGFARLVSSSGGHPLPVVVRADSSTEVVGTPGTLLGVFDHISVATAEIRLHPGDTAVFYTDGISDLPPPHWVEHDDVIAMVGEAARGARDADDVAERLHASLTRRLSDDSRHDDVAVVVLRVVRGEG